MTREKFLASADADPELQEALQDLAEGDCMAAIMVMARHLIPKTREFVLVIVSDEDENTVRHSTRSTMEERETFRTLAVTARGLAEQLGLLAPIKT